MIRLPMYKQGLIAMRDADCDAIMQCTSMEELSRTICGMDVSQALAETAVVNYLGSSYFNGSADYFQVDEYTNALARVILRVYQAAAEFGFPDIPARSVQASRIDVELCKALTEALEENNFTILPYEASHRLVQAFMTQRVFPLISFWRWKLITGKELSKNRIVSGPRNYFYTLWLSGWLFDQGSMPDGSRWELLEAMSADSLVQIIERSGIGYRKGFAQAIAMERKLRKELETTALDGLVRGCMKRATFTFATAVMPDDETYYKEICQYLFEWAEKNYLPQEEEEPE